jgi:serine/threonine protein kinase
MPMSYSIFISYRREDSQIAVSSLHKDLLARFGMNAVFADTASIQLGDEWDDRILKSLEEAKIILVIIGNNWLCTEKDKPGQFRICSKDDWVRKEIETARSLKKLLVPVLIDGAKMPDYPDLPESIKDLCSIEAQRIIFQAGDNEGVETLVEFLEKKLKSLISPDELKESLENILAEKYEVIKNIGAGNRAKVYHGRDKGLDRDVAIKVIIDPAFNDDFVDSLKEAAKINDCVPNSISVLGAYVYKDPFHVIMPYLGGGSLRKIINQNEGRAFSCKEVKKILLDIGDALVKTHNNGMIKPDNNGLSHCNVKPSNIMLNNDEYYLNPLSRVQKNTKTAIIKKLSDVSTGAPQSDYLEELCYLAPEIFDTRPSNNSAKKTSEKIDQFMLGLLGYELLSGNIPGILSSINDLKENGISAFKPLKILTEIRNDCPYKFSKVIHKMIDYDPDNRYDRLEDAISDIEEVSFNVFEIAKESYARCLSAKDSGNNFFKTFYHQLKKISPEAAEKFKGKGIGESESNRQYSILREAIFILLLFGENELGDDEPNILTRIAEMHNRKNYNVSREAYNAFVDALTATICGLSPESPEPFDKQCKISKQESEIIRQAWIAALKPGIDYMISKY